MKPGRKPQTERSGWRCQICRGPWIYSENAFADWQAHYIREHMQKEGA
jgi:hypothetical protein